MGFEICNFSDLKEGNAIFEKMRKSIDLKRLVPVLGSGFSYNFHTNGGRVPSVDDLKSEMVRLLKECEEYECTSEEELRAAELSELADTLLPILEKCADTERTRGICRPQSACAGTVHAVWCSTGAAVVGAGAARNGLL